MRYEREYFGRVKSFGGHLVHFNWKWGPRGGNLKMIHRRVKHMNNWASAVCEV